MRVTSNSVARDLVANLQQTYQRMDVLQTQLATGKQVRRPSDDPTAVRDSMTLRTAMSANGRYQQNIDDGVAWTQATDSSLDRLNQVVGRVKDLTLAAANSPLPDQSREAIYEEAKELLQEAVQVSNATNGTRFIFAGFNASATTPPFSLTTSAPDPVTGFTTTTVNGPADSGQYLNREVGGGVRMAINVPGSQLQPALQKVADVIDTLQRVINTPSTNPLPAQYQADVAALSNIYPAQLEKSADQLLSARSDIGAKMARLDATKDQLTGAQVTLQTLLSKAEDVDMTKAITDLQRTQMAYSTSLAVGARILPQTLVDFLR